MDKKNPPPHGGERIVKVITVITANLGLVLLGTESQNNVQGPTDLR